MQTFAVVVEFFTPQFHQWAPFVIRIDSEFVNEALLAVIDDSLSFALLNPEERRKKAKEGCRIVAIAVS